MHTSIRLLRQETTMQLDIATIRLDGGTQPRAMHHPGLAEEYAEAMQAGAIFPPVIVFYDGAKYWLADGFHRVLAVEHNEQSIIDADVRQGTQQDAQWYSYSVNQAHGKRRSTEDKQRAVLAALAHPKAAGMSDREIADHCGVSHPFVGSLRKQVTGNGFQSTGNGYRTGKDGVKRKTSASPAAQQSEPDEPLSPYEEQVAAAYMNRNSAPVITEPAGVGEKRLSQMVDELIQQLNFADLCRLTELLTERVVVQS